MYDIEVEIYNVLGKHILSGTSYLRAIDVLYISLDRRDLPNDTTTV